MNKKAIKITTIIFSIILIVISALKLFSIGIEKELVPLFENSQPQWKNLRDPLISSHWKQDGPYSAYSPGNELLGCWSIAFAQVLAFHQLSPCGNVAYKTYNGIVIDETFNCSVNWYRIVPSVDSLTIPENSVETVRYCYQASVVLQKDFGRGEYKNIESVPSEVSEHYNCKVEKLAIEPEKEIISEIYAGFPVVAYLNDILSIKIVRNGHAVVFDGIATDKNKILVHVNFGWAGASDGWYDLRTLASERKLLYIFSIRPI